MFAPRGWLRRPGTRQMYRTIAGSNLFERSWYRQQQRGFSRLHDPLWHYLDFGWKRGLDPSPHFDSSHYLAANPDVALSGGNPLYHYVEHGVIERRTPLRSIQQAWDYFVPDAKELPTFVSERVGKLRLTAVIDSATLARSDTSLAVVLGACLAVARRESRQLRIISLVPDGAVLHRAITELTNTPGHTEIECVYGTPGSLTTHYDVHDDEMFVATSWTSAAALRYCTEDSYLRILTPPHSSTHLGSGKLEKEGDCAYSVDFWRAWSLDALEDAQNPPGPEQHSMTEADSVGEKTLGIVVSPQHDLVAYLWVLRELEHFLLSHLAIKLRIVLIGAELEPVMFLAQWTTLLVPHIPSEGVDCAIVLPPSATQSTAAQKPGSLPQGERLIFASKEILRSRGELAGRIARGLSAQAGSS